MIHSPETRDPIEVLSHDTIDDRLVSTSKVFLPFSEDVISFFAWISKRVFECEEAKNFPDLMAFAFWCRPSNLRSLEKNYKFLQFAMGRGTVFHITPSNVPMNFAYSMAAGILSGNINIIRLPSESYPQANVLCKLIAEGLKLPAFASIKYHINLVRYGRDAGYTKAYSAMCDVRIIWGGDNTIEEIRKYPIAPHAYELTFSDRYSVCIVHADNYLEVEDHQKVAENFYNDTYLFDQNACTAPHLITWIGAEDRCEKAKEIFWDHLALVVKKRYQLQARAVIQKVTDAYDYAAFDSKCSIVKSSDNTIIRIQLESIQSGIENWRSICGLFFEYQTSDIQNIFNIVSKKFQTLIQIGFKNDELMDAIRMGLPRGIDRIVSVGRSLDFSLVWDGKDLIQLLTRRIVA